MTAFNFATTAHSETPSLNASDKELLKNGSALCVSSSPVDVASIFRTNSIGSTLGESWSSVVQAEVRMAQRSACAEHDKATDPFNDHTLMPKILRACLSACQTTATAARAKRSTLAALTNPKTPDEKETQCKEVCGNSSLIAAYTAGSSLGSAIGRASCESSDADSAARRSNRAPVR